MATHVFSKAIDNNTSHSKLHHLDIIISIRVRLDIISIRVRLDIIISIRVRLDIIFL